MLNVPVTDLKMVQATDRNKQSSPYENSVSYTKIKVASNGIYVRR
jgi:hypothetical protein